MENTKPSAEMTSPACPICGVIAPPFGRQEYPLADGSCPSTIFRCSPCDFNFRRFDRSLSDVLSHFQVASYSVPVNEQRLRDRRRRFYHSMIDLLAEPAESKSLLDVGAAFGHFLQVAAERGYRVFATEVSEAMAQGLRERTSYPVSARPLDDLDLPESTFDVISFVDSFYYFPDPVQTLRQCRELLRPGGQLLMRVTNRNALAGIYRRIRHPLSAAHRLPQLPHRTTDDAISCHSRRSLSIALARAGFEVSRLTCLEQGPEKFDWFAPRTFHHATHLLARLTFERVCLTPGIVCVATPR